MENLDKTYNKFNEEKAYDVLMKNSEYVQAREKAKEAAKELNDTLNKASLLVKKYNDCIADTTAIAYREYYKQGYKFNRK